jgi:Zn-finger nucleic acid-binding protein
MSLTCPRCSIEMTEHSAVTAAGPPVTVDICGQCKGLWLDAQKLALVCPTVADLPARKTEILLIGQAGANIRTCPRCSATPYEFAVMEDMRVDFCPGCAGVWLDGDEYEEGVFELPADSRRSRERSPYRSAGDQAEKKREVTCQDCARPVTVATSYVWEYGFLCRACYAVKEQRASLRRVSESQEGMASVGTMLGDVLSWVLAGMGPPRR